MEGCFDEVAGRVDDGLAATLDSANHDVGPDAAVLVGLAMHVVAEVVAVGGMFFEVAQGPGTADDGLDAEDICLGAVDFALHDAGDIGLELDVVDQLHFAVFEEGDVEVALIGALFAALWVDAEDAGGVGGFEAEGAVAAVIVVVDADVQLVSFDTDQHRASFADQVFQ